MTGSAPILEMKDISKTFPGVKALTNVSLDGLSRRNSCADGRERRRQIDADEDPVRRLPGRSGRRDPHRRPARHHRRSADRTASRHLDHLSGAFARAEPYRWRRTCCSGASTSPARWSTAVRWRRPASAVLERLGVHFKRDDEGQRTVDGRAAARRDRPRAASRIRASWSWTSPPPPSPPARRRRCSR